MNQLKNLKNIIKDGTVVDRYRVLPNKQELTGLYNYTLFEYKTFEEAVEKINELEN